MSAFTTNTATLWCDGCQIEIEAEDITVRDIRRFGKEEGWRHYLDGVDLCPECQVVRDDKVTIEWVRQHGTGVAHRPDHWHPYHGWAILCGEKLCSGGPVGQEVVLDDEPRPPRCCHACQAELERRRLLRELEAQQ